MKTYQVIRKRIQVMGLVTALTAGLVAAPGVQAKTKKTITLSISKATLSVGDTLTLKVKGKKKSAKVKWTSSKKKVAIVSKKGVVKAKKAGNTKITAKVGKKKAVCKVKVKKIVAAVSTNTPAATAAPTATPAAPTASAEPKVTATPDAQEKDGNRILTLWTGAAAAKKELISYMEAITKEGSADFIPVKDRIAVFDLDGTLFCETDPNYFDYTLLHYRVLLDPEYKDKASDFEKEVAEKIQDQNENGTSYSGLEVDHGKAVASAFKGMTLKEFNDYIQTFKQQPMPSYDGMKRGEGFYKPMLQVVDYLKANDFTVYIVSGTDRFIVRGIVDNSPLDLPARQIIGSDESLVAPDQGDTDGLNYTYDDNDKLVLGGDFLIKNLKMNKVTVIMQEIGQQPVLSFGNSTGDASMAEFVTSENQYKSKAFMLCCDDTVRENGNEKKAENMKNLCGEYDWVPISMRDDWTTIYGEGVTKK